MVDKIFKCVAAVALVLAGIGLLIGGIAMTSKEDVNAGPTMREDSEVVAARFQVAVAEAQKKELDSLIKQVSDAYTVAANNTIEGTPTATSTYVVVNGDKKVSGWIIDDEGVHTKYEFVIKSSTKDDGKWDNATEVAVITKQDADETDAVDVPSFDFAAAVGETDIYGLVNVRDIVAFLPARAAKTDADPKHVKADFTKIVVGTEYEATETKGWTATGELTDDSAAAIVAARQLAIDEANETLKFMIANTPRIPVLNF